MDKIIHYTIAISPATRQSQAIQYEFYSHDRNNAKLTFDLPESLAETSVRALFYFTRSKAKWETVGTVEGGRVIVAFDTTLITQDETVTGYLYFKTATQEADVFQFRLAVKLSKIDRDLAYKTHRTETPTINLDDYVTKVDLEERLKHFANGGGTYDDSNIQARIRELESRTDKDTIYDDSGLQRRVSALEARPSGSTYDDSELKQRVTTLENRKPKLSGSDGIRIVEQPGDNYEFYFDTAGQISSNSGQIGLIKQQLAKTITTDDFKPTVMQHALDTLSKQVDNLPKGKLGQNLLSNSGNKVTNKQYPTTYLSFVQQPTVGTQYTLTVKVDAPASKTGVVVQVRGNVSFGALNKVGDGIYSSTFTWNPRPQDKPFELVVYQPPNNNVEASLVWAKFVEGVDTDYTWYPNYNEVSNVYTFAEEASTAIESSANLLEGTLAEKTSATEFMSYADIAPVIDTYGVGKYTLSFDLKAKTAGTMGVYMSGTTKYTFLQEAIPVTTEYQRITMHLDITTNTPTATAAALSFFGGKYGNGVIPSVRKLRLSKGIYKELPWKPSDKELTGMYEKMMS